MRISDWSSDVCSSDLDDEGYHEARREGLRRHGGTTREKDVGPSAPIKEYRSGQSSSARRACRSCGHRRCRRLFLRDDIRSEERRVGKEWVSTWRYRRMTEE